MIPKKESANQIGIVEAIRRHVDTVITVRAIYRQIVELKEWLSKNGSEHVSNFVFTGFWWSAIRFVVLELNILLENHRDKDCKLNRNAVESKNLAWVLDQIKMHHSGLGLVHRDKKPVDVKYLPTSKELKRGFWAEEYLPEGFESEWIETPFTSEEVSNLIESLQTFFERHQNRINRLKTLRDKMYAHHDPNFLKDPVAFEREIQLKWGEFEEVLDDLAAVCSSLHYAFIHVKMRMDLETVGNMHALLDQIRAAERLWKSGPMLLKAGIDANVFFSDKYELTHNPKQPKNLS
jgi:hypothetical protein